MHLQSNPQLDLAYEYVCYTNKSIFLTGKAGTGKTTFLHRIKDEPVKRMVVVAPTGVAAINAGGMTIHSFFQLPFGPYLPGSARDAARQRKFSGEKIRLIRSLDLLVIDEISMVRADLLDGVDEVLRRYKNPTQPFGGVQLLMIGDLHQLPPVVKENEWDMLRAHYQTPYFFGSHALQQTRPVIVELKHIFRQSDRTFIDLLNRVRDNEIDEEVLATLNSRFVPAHQIRDEDAYITLTTHNATAHTINAEKLAAIGEPVRRYQAEIAGDFPAHAYPTDETLELKPGAQVMFVRNDPSPEKRYYNGKIGKITRISEDLIYVRCPDDGEEIDVEPTTWENMKYTLNEQTKEVAEEVVGAFTQYPLKLAWAITIHKSQGLTFERVILDAHAAFAHGQVYVALSRCKSFEGIVLRSKIAYSSVRTDATVQRFSEEAERNAPDQAHLEQAKIDFQQSLILELFDFRNMKNALEHMNRLWLEHESKLQPGAYAQYKALATLADAGVIPVGDKFRAQLRRLFAEGGLPETNEAVQERIRKAAAWFADKLADTLEPTARDLPVVSDNRKVRTAAREALESLQKAIFIKKACFTTARAGFATHEYLRAKANAELDFQAAGRGPAPSASPARAARQTPHPELYARLHHWRDDRADADDMPPFQVLPTKSLFELVRLLPLSKAGLKEVHGIGKGRVRQFGDELLAIIRNYCDTHDVASPVEEELARKKAPKPDTKALSFDLFRAGKTIDEIAAERGFVRSTIEGHLAHYVGQGELSVYDLIDREKIQAIEAFFTTMSPESLTDAKAQLGDDYSYGEIKLVLEHMRLEEAKAEEKPNVDG